MKEIILAIISVIMLLIMLWIALTYPLTKKDTPISKIRGKK